MHWPPVHHVLYNKALLREFLGVQISTLVLSPQAFNNHIVGSIFIFSWLFEISQFQQVKLLNSILKLSIIFFVYHGYYGFHSTYLLLSESLHTHWASACISGNFTHNNLDDRFSPTCRQVLCPNPQASFPSSFFRLHGKMEKVQGFSCEKII